MPDLYVRIEFDSPGNQAKALRELDERFPDFLWPALPWWHKPPDNARALVARTLSRHGCKGRLSLTEHVPGAPFDQPPPPVWTGFSPSTRK